MSWKRGDPGPGDFLYKETAEAAAQPVRVTAEGDCKYVGWVGSRRVEDMPGWFAAIVVPDFNESGE